MNILTTEKRVAVVSALVEGCSIRSTCRLGSRDAAHAHRFISDLQSRLAKRVQLTADGNWLYLDAVDTYFQGDMDYAQLVKLYGTENKPENRYSPGKCLGTWKEQVNGKLQRKTTAGNVEGALQSNEPKRPLDFYTDVHYHQKVETMCSLADLWQFNTLIESPNDFGRGSGFSLDSGRAILA